MSKWPKRPTQARADQFFYEVWGVPNIPASERLPDELVAAFLEWGGWEEKHRGRAYACLRKQSL